jgi:hypothetical protein
MAASHLGDGMTHKALMMHQQLEVSGILAIFPNSQQAQNKIVMSFVSSIIQYSTEHLQSAEMNPEA